MTARALALAALLATVACRETTAPSAATAHWDGVSACDYRVSVTAAKSLGLDVAVSCHGRALRGLEAEDPRVAERIGVVTSNRGATTRRGNAFMLARPAPQASFRYQVDLGELARASDDLNLAVASSESVLAAASSFLLYPLPLDVGIAVNVWFDAPREAVTSALARHGDHYALEAHEISVGTYTAFGRQRVERVTLAAPRATELELVLLDGKLDLDAATLRDFVRTRAEAVAAFYGGFPGERATVMVLPKPGRTDVVFGKLLPESAPGVVLLVGSEARGAALNDDWVLVHELFHIGVPSFDREGKWFDEGLATYFEPIIRVRAGLYDEARAWHEFITQMPRGLPALTRDGLEQARGNAGVYWGGALFCLLADVEARRRSGGARGLEDGVRRVFAAGGRASEVWDLSRALITADGAFEHPLLVPLAKRFARAPAALDLEQLFAELGVRRSASGVTFDDSAKLASVRRALFTGGVNARTARADPAGP